MTPGSINMPQYNMPEHHAAHTAMLKRPALHTRLPWRGTELLRDSVVRLGRLEEGPEEGPDQAQDCKQVEDEGPAQASYDRPADDQPHCTPQIQSAKDGCHGTCPLSPATMGLRAQHLRSYYSSQGFPDEVKLHSDSGTCSLHGVCSHAPWPC